VLTNSQDQEHWAE
jgi:hypothetical protein